MNVVYITRRIQTEGLNFAYLSAESSSILGSIELGDMRSTAQGTTRQSAKTQFTKLQQEDEIQEETA